MSTSVQAVVNTDFIVACVINRVDPRSVANAVMRVTVAGNVYESAARVRVSATATEASVVIDSTMDIPVTGNITNIRVVDASGVTLFDADVANAVVQAPGKYNFQVKYSVVFDVAFTLNVYVGGQARQVQAQLVVNPLEALLTRGVFPQDVDALVATDSAGNVYSGSASAVCSAPNQTELRCVFSGNVARVPELAGVKFAAGQTDVVVITLQTPVVWNSSLDARVTYRYFL